MKGRNPFLFFPFLLEWYKESEHARRWSFENTYPTVGFLRSEEKSSSWDEWERDVEEVGDSTEKGTGENSKKEEDGREDVVVVVLGDNVAVDADGDADAASDGEDERSNGASMEWKRQTIKKKRNCQGMRELKRKGALMIGRGWGRTRAGWLSAISALYSRSHSSIPSALSFHSSAIPFSSSACFCSRASIPTLYSSHLSLPSCASPSMLPLGCPPPLQVSQVKCCVSTAGKNEGEREQTSEKEPECGPSQGQPPRMTEEREKEIWQTGRKMSLEMALEEYVSSPFPSLF